MEMYPRWIAVRRVELEGEPRERETYVAKAASLRLKIGGVVGLMEKAEISGVKVGESGGGWGGSGEGMWSRHTFSLACLEPTRTGVGSPGAKTEREVGVRTQEPEDCRRGEMARREWDKRESGAVQKGTGKGRRGKWR